MVRLASCTRQRSLLRDQLSIPAPTISRLAPASGTRKASVCTGAPLMWQLTAAET
jgi:hypothetical protein